MRVSTLLLIIGLCFSAVQAQTELRVLATTTLLADVAQNVAGDRFTVDALIPPDADAHAFEPSPADAARVAEADVLLTVGAGYEAFLGDLLTTVGSNVPEVVDVSEGIALRALDGDAADCEIEAEHEEHEGEDEGHDHADAACDPHVWTDPSNVILWVRNITAAFGRADPANAADYAVNGAAYVEVLTALDADIAESAAQVPEERRILVTNHEFLGYFADAYGFQVVGTVLPGTTNQGEPTPQELAALIETIRSAGVRAVFVETSANPQLAQVVAEEAGIDVVTTLYSESLSDTDGPAPTYVDYMRFNADAIVSALAGP